MNSEEIETMRESMEGSVKSDSNKTTTIVITAATPWESRPLIERWSLIRRDNASGVYQGRVHGKDIILVETGIGLKNTEAMLEYLGKVSTSIVISSGFAGALQSGMRTGDIVVDPYGAPLSLLEGAQKTASAQGRVLHVGRVISTSSVLANPEEKRCLGVTRRAAAVDMESAAARRWALDQGADFLTLRVVLDSIDQRMPKAVPASSRWSDLVLYALSNWRDWALFFKLMIWQRRGMNRLGEFLDGYLSRVQ